MSQQNNLKIPKLLLCVFPVFLAIVMIVIAIYTEITSTKNLYDYAIYAGICILVLALYAFLAGELLNSWERNNNTKMGSRQ